MTKDTLTLIRPDDWHIHFRDGEMMAAVVPETARVFGRAIVMPNLSPPVTDRKAVRAYRERVCMAVPDGIGFEPLMTLYLTDASDPEEIAGAFAAGEAAAVKLYPAGATTNSNSGVTDIHKPDAVLSIMAEIGMPLLIHGEVTDAHVDIFDREAEFIEVVLKPLLDRHPDLKVVLEHITTRQSVEFVQSAGERVGATVTPHHMEINRTDMFRGGIRPHLYCLPIAKREEHRLAVREAATSGHHRFFLGTDSAPHPVHAKESDCGCAGIYNAPNALAVYAEIFDSEGALDRLEAFSSLNGPRFYGLPVNTDRVTLFRKESIQPQSITVETDRVMLYRAGETIHWSVEPAA